MDIIFSIFLTFAIIYGAYIIFCAVMSHIGASELEKAGIDPDGGDIVFKADARTLEHLVACAAWATTFERRKIVILLDGDDGDLSQTAQRLCLSHKNIICRRIK